MPPMMDQITNLAPKMSMKPQHPCPEHDLRVAASHFKRLFCMYVTISKQILPRNLRSKRRFRPWSLIRVVRVHVRVVLPLGQRLSLVCGPCRPGLGDVIASHTFLMARPGAGSLENASKRKGLFVVFFVLFGSFWMFLGGLSCGAPFRRPFAWLI